MQCPEYLAYLPGQDDEKLAEALEYATMAVEQNPDEADYLDTYGYPLHRSGQPAQAAASLAAAIQRYEARGKIPVNVYEHLGLVNEALGEWDKAPVAHRRALGVGDRRVQSRQATDRGGRRAADAVG